MTHNPYTAPTAELKDPPLPKRAWIPVAMGVICYEGLTSALSWPLFLFTQLGHSISGGSQESFFRDVLASEAYLAMLLAINLVGAAFGGYIAARIATSRPMMLAFFAGLVSLAMGAFEALSTFASYYPVWWKAMFLLFCVPCYLAGARYCRRRDELSAADGGANEAPDGE